jgi:hypothetical protein
MLQTKVHQYLRGHEWEYVIMSFLAMKCDWMNCWNGPPRERFRVYNPFVSTCLYFLHLHPLPNENHPPVWLRYEGKLGCNSENMLSYHASNFLIMWQLVLVNILCVNLTKFEKFVALSYRRFHIRCKSHFRPHVFLKKNYDVVQVMIIHKYNLTKFGKIQNMQEDSLKHLFTL